jgi:hypothetical protein
VVQSALAEARQTSIVTNSRVCPEANSAITSTAVEHTCYKCGSPVESGRPFCPHCRAPQIRVEVAEVAADAPVSTHPLELDLPSPEVPATSFVQWSHALTAAALAGIVSAVLMNLFFGFFGIGIAAAGILSVRMYRHRVGGTLLTTGTGARIGAVSGVFGFVFFSIIAAVGTAIFGGRSELKAALLSSLEQAAARSADPQAQVVFEKMRTPEGLILLLALSLAFIFFLFVALSSLGGALAASMSSKRRPKERP